MVDVVFVTPNLTCTAGGEPTGTLILATLLKNNGFSVKILPMGKFGDVQADFDAFIDNAVNSICRTEAKIISFYTRCDTYHLDLQLAIMLKKQMKDSYIVFGGPQSDLCAEDTLKAFSCVDFICRGEGETTIVPFFTSLLRRTPDLSIPGLVYALNDKVISNPRPELLEDLSSATPDYSLLTEAGDEVPDSFMPMDVGRGCPFSCTFCSTKSFWKRRYRLKEPEQICSEMLQMHQLYGVTKFSFEHDMFTMNRRKVIEICQLIKQLPFPAKWGCSARLDCLDEELIDIMCDAGFEGVFIGIETGSPRMQKLVNKNLDLTRAEPIIRYLSSKNARTTVSFIYGFPEETEEDLSETIALWKKLYQLGNVSFQWHLLSFSPGTELERIYHDKLTFTEVFSNHTGDYGATQCIDMIRSHPELFAQYSSYETELRRYSDKLVLFLNEYKRYFRLFEYLLPRYYKNEFDMYLKWRNTDGEKRTKKTEQFFELHKEDERYPIITDILRYYRDRRAFGKLPPDAAPMQSVYCFDVKELKSGKPIEQFTQTVTMIRFEKTSSGALQEYIAKE